jgi:hypothetical protein
MGTRTTELNDDGVCLGVNGPRSGLSTCATSAWSTSVKEDQTMCCSWLVRDKRKELATYFVTTRCDVRDTM